MSDEHDLKSDERAFATDTTNFGEGFEVLKGVNANQNGLSSRASLAAFGGNPFITVQTSGTPPAENPTTPSTSTPAVAGTPTAGSDKGGSG